MAEARVEAGGAAAPKRARGEKSKPSGSSQSELPVVQKTYDLLVWLLPQIERFPRAQRFALGARIEEHLFGMLELLLDARFRREGRGAILDAVSSRLVRLKYLLRLSVELRYLPLAKQEHLARELAEIGRMVGGWAKQAGPA